MYDLIDQISIISNYFLVLSGQYNNCRNSLFPYLYFRTITAVSGIGYIKVICESLVYINWESSYCINDINIKFTKNIMEFSIKLDDIFDYYRDGVEYLDQNSDLLKKMDEIKNVLARRCKGYF